jgi:hypothetical protein
MTDNERLYLAAGFLAGVVVGTWPAWLPALRLWLGVWA